MKCEVCGEEVDERDYVFYHNYYGKGGSLYFHPKECHDKWLQGD